MRLTRYLKAGQVKLELETTPPDPLPETWSAERLREHLKESVLAELVDLLYAAGKVGNRKKLLEDLVNREKKATTGIGGGLAIPHVRTMQAKEFAIAFGRSRRGIDFGALDDQPCHFFICVVAPPYDDKLYLQVYRRLGEVFLREDLMDRLRETDDPHEAVRLLSQFDEN